MGEEFEFKLIITRKDDIIGYTLVSLWDGRVYSSLSRDEVERIGRSTRVKFSEDWEEVGSDTLYDVDITTLNTFKITLGLTRLYGEIPQI